MKIYNELKSGLINILLVNVVLVVLLVFTTRLVGQTYISLEQSATTIVEGSYLDLQINVNGDWDFSNGSGFYVYVEKIYASGNHFAKYSRKLVFIDSTMYQLSISSGFDTDTIDKNYTFKLLNYEYQDSMGLDFSQNSEIAVIVKDIPTAKKLPTRGLFFSGVAGTGAPYNSSAFYLSNSVPIQPGTSFSIVNGTYNANNSGGTWSGSNSSLSTIYVIYVGDQELEEGTNFCIFITDINPLDLNLGITISVNGIEQSENFLINSGGTPNDITFSSDRGNTYFITQGQWYKQNGDYKLLGSVIDGIAIGQNQEDIDVSGIPSGLGGGMTGLGGVTDIEGSFYAILVCDGLIYVCDITEYILNPVNWESYIGPDGQVDLQALCDDLCGYASECDEDIQIEKDDCLLSLSSDLPCDDPLIYKWKHLINGNEWVVVEEGDIIANIVPDYTVTDNGYYLLEIDCEGGCSFASNTLIANYCEDCIANLYIQQVDCRLYSELTNCEGNPTYQWFKMGLVDWVIIDGATEYVYEAEEPGNYKLEVFGCENCGLLSATYEYTDKATITLDKEEVYLRNFKYCGYWNYLLDIIVDGNSLNTEPQFHFPYEYNVIGMQQIVEDLNTWFSENGYYGHAWQNWSGKPPCIFIDCTEKEFQYISIIRGSEYLVEPWEIVDEPECESYHLILRASAPCTPISFLWNTGATTETILYNENIKYYSVTVTCENGCVYTGEKYFGLFQGISQKDENNIQHSKILVQEKYDKKRNNPMLKVYPVPTDNWLKVEMTADEKSIYTLELYNLIGDKIKSIKQTLKKGNNLFDLDTSELPGGVYLLEVKGCPEYNVSRVVITR